MNKQSYLDKFSILEQRMRTTLEESISEIKALVKEMEYINMSIKEDDNNTCPLICILPVDDRNFTEEVMLVKIVGIGYSDNGYYIYYTSYGDDTYYDKDSAEEECNLRWFDDCIGYEFILDLLIGIQSFI